MRIARRLILSTIAVALLGAVAVAGVAWHRGYRIYVVHTGSMVPALNPGDAILDRPAPSNVHPGEVVTFSVNSGPDKVVTHRVASIADDTIKTKGDANPTPDPWTLHMSQVVGTALTALPYMGYVLVYLKQPQGTASVATAFIGLALLWQLFFPAAPRHQRRHGLARAPRQAAPAS